MFKCLKIQTYFTHLTKTFLVWTYFLFVPDHFQNMAFLAASFPTLKKLPISFRIKFKHLYISLISSPLTLPRLTSLLYFRHTGLRAVKTLNKCLPQGLCTCCLYLEPLFPDIYLAYSLKSFKFLLNILWPKRPSLVYLYESYSTFYNFINFSITFIFPFQYFSLKHLCIYHMTPR